MKCASIFRKLEHPLRWPAFQRVARLYLSACLHVEHYGGGLHVAGHAIYGPANVPVGS
jgi:hypothetical protein